MTFYLRRLKYYRHTFLSRDRLPTRDVEKVERSRFVYFDIGEGWYATSVLGILNGLIWWTGFRLVFDVTAPDEDGARYILRVGLRWFGR